MPESCGNCYFFMEHKGELCVRFPPPQQARVHPRDWCGEWEQGKETSETPKKPLPTLYPPAQSVTFNDKDGAPPLPPVGRTVPGSLTKAERLKNFGDLAGRLK